MRIGGGVAEAKAGIYETRALVKSEQWCGKVTVNESPCNRGLAQSIITGVTEIVNKYGKVIVLEDDIVIGRHFLEYTNAALDKYRDEKAVWEITGFCVPIGLNGGSAWFRPVECCWGWATWADRWQYFKKDTKYYISTWTSKMIRAFNADGNNSDYWNQILANDNGSLNTWAIFWYATIFEHAGLTLVPTSSIVRNIGLDGTGEHCGESPAEEIEDSIDGEITHFPEKIEVSENEYKIWKRYQRKKTKPVRSFVRKKIVSLLQVLGLYNVLRQLIKGKSV